jgi:hypothetical protein
MGEGLGIVLGTDLIVGLCEGLDEGLGVVVSKGLYVGLEVQ